MISRSLTVLLLIAFCFALVLPAAAVDPLGTLTIKNVSCSSVQGSDGIQGSTCYLATVSCPSLPDIQPALKVNLPTGTSKGTVLYSTGGGGNSWYDTNFTYGTTAIQNVINAGYTAVQVDYLYVPKGSQGKILAGWLTGPGGARSLSCRWATIADYVYKNFRTGTAPLCTASASAGANAPAYAMAFYGLASEFKMVEQTSGPTFTQIDNGCLCNAPAVQTACGQGALSQCYQGEAGLYIDPTYQNHTCTNAEKTHTSTYLSKYQHDSLLATDALTTFPNTYIHILLGGLDKASGPPQATAWQNSVTGSNVPTVDCIADAAHGIADTLDGATRIANDLIQSCK
ncbi:MAG: hypothetical protein H0X25_15875 [Acidobacteriales bacterium]|nr:hypothetical protein [Terriglobales bacterium]